MSSAFQCLDVLSSMSQSSRSVKGPICPGVLGCSVSSVTHDRSSALVLESVFKSQRWVIEGHRL